MRLFPIVLLAGSLACIVPATAGEKPSTAKGKLTSIQGIAAATEAKLKNAGVNSVDELRDKGAT